MASDSAPPAAFLKRLDDMNRRVEELDASLNDPEVLSQSQKVVTISKELGRLRPTVEEYRNYLKTLAEQADLEKLIAEPADAEMAELARTELPEVRARAAAIMEGLTERFLTAEDDAIESFFIEIRAGTGGDEAALFAGDLFEMYRKYCESRGWTYQPSDFSPGDVGGFKEIIVNIRGAGAYHRMKFEGGGHRVQRVPQTEAQGRIHTSAATVAILPEVQDVHVHIEPRDIDEQACRGGGPGGQNVNKVETGWRIIHRPSGLMFKITELRSQGQNKERAWALLRAKLYELERAKQHAEMAKTRKSMIGSGDRSERVRTYNFPQNRCTDHRLGEGAGEKNHSLAEVMQGRLDPIIDPLLQLDRTQRLASL